MIAASSTAGRPPASCWTRSTIRARFAPSDTVTGTCTSVSSPGASSATNALGFTQTICGVPRTRHLVTVAPPNTDIVAVSSPPSTVRSTTSASTPAPMRAATPDARSLPSASLPNSTTAGCFSSISAASASICGCSR